MRDLKEKLETIDGLVRGGRLKEAWSALEPLLKLSPPPPDRIRIASFLRRMNRASQARTYLASLVLGRGRTLPHSSPEAKIEYAEILLNLGLVREARRFLLDRQTASLPLAKVRIGYSYLYENEHEHAVKALGEALSDQGAIIGYERAIVTTNWILARAHVEVDPEPLQRLHRELECFQKEFSASHYEILVHALHAVDLQIRFKLGQSPPSVSIAGTQTYSVLMVKLYQRCIQRAPRSTFLRLRQEAEAVKLFEVVREIDLKYALVSDDESRLGEIEGSSESKGFKRRLIREAAAFDLRIIPPRKKAIHVDTNGEYGLPPKLIRLLQLLSEERYAPLTPAMLWDRLVDEKYFRGQSSIGAIHQWVHRLKMKLAENPETRNLRIVWDQTGYRLSGADVRFHFPEAIAQTKKREQNHGYLVWKTKWNEFQIEGGAGHSTGDAKITLASLRRLMPGIPARTHQYYLQLAVERGDLIRMGRGKRTQYKAFDA